MGKCHGVSRYSFSGSNLQWMLWCYKSKTGGNYDQIQCNPEMLNPPKIFSCNVPEWMTMNEKYFNFLYAKNDLPDYWSYSNAVCTSRLISSKESRRPTIRAYAWQHGPIYGPMHGSISWAYAWVYAWEPDMDGCLKPVPYSRFWHQFREEPPLWNFIEWKPLLLIRGVNLVWKLEGSGFLVWKRGRSRGS